MKYKEVKSIVNNAIESTNNYEDALSEICRNLKLSTTEKSLLNFKILYNLSSIVNMYFDNRVTKYTIEYVNNVFLKLQKDYIYFYYPLFKIWTIDMLKSNNQIK